MRAFQHSQAPQNIVVFRALQLGDLLCTVPSFRSLRAAFPQARITLVGLPWASTFVARFAHYLDDFIEFPGWPGLPESEPQFEQIPAFLQALQSQHYDLALQMQGSGVISNPLVALFGARRTLGYSLAGQFTPDPAAPLQYPEDEHEVRIFLRLVEIAGAPAQGEYLEFPIYPQERADLDGLRGRARIETTGYICLHPGARFEGRRWPVEKFAQVGDGLYRMGYQVLLTGTQEEQALTREVRQLMRHPALDLAGQTSLGVLAALLEGARLLISNDTGVSHLAAALGVPSLVLFSASEPERWRPLDQALHHILQNSFQVAPKQVLEEVDALLKEEHRHARESF